MTRLAYLGPEGTFAHQATDLVRSVPAGATWDPRTTVHEIVHAVADGAYDLGLVPIENSVDGGVTGTVDVLVFDVDGVAIREEVVVPVTFGAHRRSEAGNVALTTVLSHPVGLAQTTHWWRSRGLTPRSTSSTSEACRLVAASDDRGLVAVASVKAAALVGLETVAEAVEDHAGAATRFALVGRGDHPDPTGDDKTTIVVTPPSDVAGILLRILGPISERGINLSNILSRPLRQALGTYCFVLTLDRHADDPDVTGALGELTEFGCTVKALGSYPAWRPR